MSCNADRTTAFLSSQTRSCTERERKRDINYYASEIRSRRSVRSLEPPSIVGNQGFGKPTEEGGKGWPKGVGELDGYRLPLSGSASSSCNLLPPSEPRPRGQDRSSGDFMNILFVEVARCTRSLRTRRYLGSVNIFSASPSSAPLRPPTTTDLPPPPDGEGIIYERIVKVEQIAKEDFTQR